jgi:threonyl-tRNA synthetase
MANFKSILDKWSKSLPEMIKRVMSSKTISEKIIELNQFQLKILGEDVNGEKLRTYSATGGNAYSAFTIEKKKEKGQPYDHVTLFDTGRFYKTFSTITNDQFSQVKADSKVEDGDISDNVDLSNVYGLTKESKQELVQYLRMPLIREFKNGL